MGREPWIFTCQEEANLLVFKEHMVGTANTASIAAEETFCSRNPNFTGSIKPGAAHFNWAIFHNVPWKGGQVSLEWGGYGRSRWVDPWHSAYPSDVPLPAVCPPELVTLGTCQPAVQPGQLGLPPGFDFVCLGGRPGEQCNQPPELIRHPVEWSQDPLKILQESPFSVVEINNLLQQHKGLVCGMELIPVTKAFETLMRATSTGIAVGADIITGDLYMIPKDIAPVFDRKFGYLSCAEVLAERKALDPTQW